MNNIKKILGFASLLILGAVGGTGLMVLSATYEKVDSSTLKVTESVETNHQITALKEQLIIDQNQKTVIQNICLEQNTDADAKVVATQLLIDEAGKLGIK